MSTIVRQVTVQGRVQGVGYRAFVEYQAMKLDLEGWVRNRRDGSVEALFAGPAEAVAEIIARCRRGPSSARVTKLDEQPGSVDALDLRRPGERFSTLPTL
ncbi:acylphosphatase [Rhodopseudomonas palustris]|uniref:Acylphosphatase n=1 Tax=Rhodopseudomonas palustris (strain BisB18) TaxID=316056 RepID=ACYP_RHOPB|nr:RecName: Full=Acylphosphatase; AltName: Full=Acylphosphate phosphohydrolase [Rhodopseudomonas palustris BisB18]